MADRQRLRLTLRDRIDGRTWTGKTNDVTADPDDHATLLKHLEQMVRSLDHRTGDPWWLGQYEIKVQSLDQEWRRPFTLPGVK